MSLENTTESRLVMCLFDDFNLYIFRNILKHISIDEISNLSNEIISISKLKRTNMPYFILI
jgi:hypothetical protein